MLEAKSLWNSYTPNLGESQLAGIDSSWNFIPYQGFYLFAVEAVSILRDCSYTVEPLFNLGVGTLSVEENGEIVYDPERNFKVWGWNLNMSQLRGALKSQISRSSTAQS
jgi:hypothetical protein